MRHCVDDVQHYSIAKYQDLNALLGTDWHYRGTNQKGDISYVILDSVEFYLHRRKPLKEYLSETTGPVKVVRRDIGYMLVFCFAQGNGTATEFGK